ncbi:MAG: hypothetical protein WC768_05080 [Patescibacteria group bacterium]|jgi:hypothetical protein
MVSWVWLAASIVGSIFLAAYFSTNAYLVAEEIKRHAAKRIKSPTGLQLVITLLFGVIVFICQQIDDALG